MNKNKLLNFAITFLLIYLVVSLFTQGKQEAPIPNDTITITTTKNDFGQNETVSVNIKNNTDKLATIKNDCPDEPLNVYKNENGEWKAKTNSADLKCEDKSDIVIKPGEETSINYLSWNHSLFNETGRYKITANISLKSTSLPESQQTTAVPGTASQLATQLETQMATQTSTVQPANQINPLSTSKDQSKTVESNEFQVKPQGWFSYLWTVAFYQPIYNTLVLLTSTLPYHDLGFAIILLTIIIRTILLIPSQRALKSQRKLQEIQPKINRLREKYKDNQEMIAKETMALWKEHKVNPFGSCLPLLIQFPVLIALFYVIQSGLNPNNTYLLYDGLKNFSLNNINVNFLGILNLTQINHFVLPLIVGGLQFAQMKLAISKKENKQIEKKEKNIDQMQAANQMMIYVMPIMIAIFTASTPAGVGLYWSTTTIYGIIQQLVVNKQVEEESSGVKVITRPHKNETSGK